MFFNNQNSSLVGARHGTTAVELIMLMPVTIVIILVSFWLTRVYSAKHTAWTESSVKALAKAHEVNHTGNQHATLTIPIAQQTDLAYFLSQWKSAKNLRRGIASGNGEEDTGDGVEADSEGLGVVKSEDWLLADPWKDAFVYPSSRHEQPMLTLPKSVQAIVPRGLPRLRTDAFTRLSNF